MLPGVDNPAPGSMHEKGWLHMAHFKVENLGISFGGIRAVDNVSFEVKKNSIFSIIGPNGSGKTTIFNMISGIYKPDSGRVVLEGEDMVGLRPDRITRKGIARTFQNILGGAFMWGKWSGTAKEEVKNREIVEHIVDFLELQSVRDQFVSSLPYGKRKLVELGRALALEPKVLLLDEPSAGMNTEEKDDLRSGSGKPGGLPGDNSAIEHDLNLVMGVRNRSWHINQGVEIIVDVHVRGPENPDVIAPTWARRSVDYIKNIETVTT
jgi:branched-chain amino acid transport system ATP-binding protein